MLKAEIAQKLSWIHKTLLVNDGFQGPRNSSFNGFDQSSQKNTLRRKGWVCRAVAGRTTALGPRPGEISETPGEEDMSKKVVKQWGKKACKRERKE